MDGWGIVALSYRRSGGVLGGEVYSEWRERVVRYAVGCESALWIWDGDEYKMEGAWTVMNSLSISSIAFPVYDTETQNFSLQIGPFSDITTRPSTHTTHIHKNCPSKCLPPFLLPPTLHTPLHHHHILPATPQYTHPKLSQTKVRRHRPLTHNTTLV